MIVGIFGTSLMSLFKFKILFFQSLRSSWERAIHIQLLVCEFILDEMLSNKPVATRSIARSCYFLKIETKFARNSCVLLENRMEWLGIQKATQKKKEKKSPQKLKKRRNRINTTHQRHNTETRQSWKRPISTVLERQKINVPEAKLEKEIK